MHGTGYQVPGKVVIFFTKLLVDFTRESDPKKTKRASLSVKKNSPLLKKVNVLFPIIYTAL